MENFDYVLMMVDEACKSHSTSYHVLCVEDEHERYIMRAEWVNGAPSPSLYIMYEDVNGGLEVYHEVSDISDTQSIKDLLEVWDDIEEMFGEE